MSNFEHEATQANESSARRVLLATGIGLGVAATAGVLAASAETAPQRVPAVEVPCDPNMDVCVPGVTAPEDAEPVPGNPQPGETIPIDDEFDDKGGELTTTTTSTTTTVPATTTTTVPATTTTTTTTPATTTTNPATTTTAPATTVVVTTAPPTLPPITVTVPTTPGHTN